MTTRLPNRVQRLRDRWYPDERQRDPVSYMRLALDEFTAPEFEVIDIGAGAGEVNIYDLRGKVRRVVGVDLNRRVLTNPLLDEAKIGDIAAIPCPDQSFDLAFSIYVLEHVEDPGAVARELNRILRPGGVFLALTPSRWHYVSIIGGVTPTLFHEWFNERVRGREREDTFPTTYRMNSRKALRNTFECAGFDTVRIEAFEVCPHYLQFNTVSFVAGAIWERCVNRLEFLAPLRVNLLGVFRKR